MKRAPGRSRPSALLGAALAVALALAGCAGGWRGDQLLDAGDYAGAATLYEEILARDTLTRQRRIKTLSNLALLLSQPGSDLYDSDRATELLQELLDAGASGSYRLQARTLLDTQRVLGRLYGDMSTERRRAGSLTHELEALRADLETLGTEMGVKEERIERLTRRIQELARSVDELTAEVGRRENELRRLKAVDLAPPP